MEKLSASAAQRSNVPILVLVTIVCIAALGIHIRSLCCPLLYYDDYDILLRSFTWADTCANLWVPVNEHSWPLTRFGTWAVIQAAGRPTALPLAAAVYGRLMLVVGLVLLYLFVRRELDCVLCGLVTLAIFGVSAVYQEAVFWYAATPALPALDTTLLALLAAQRWRQSGRALHLVLSAFWSALAPGWYAGGILAGPLCSLYLLYPGAKVPPEGLDTRVRRWTGLVPLLGSLAFLAVSLPLTAEQIYYAEHYGSENALQAFGIKAALVNTGRSLVDNLTLGALGVVGLACPIAEVIAVLLLLAVGGVWWWRRVPDRRLLVLGLGFILTNYLLIYGARAGWSYATQLFGWSRYNVFPQLGVALIVCAGLPRGRSAPDGLTRNQVRSFGWLVAALFVLQLPRGIIGTHAADPALRTVLQQVEVMDARCRAHRIDAATARSVLKPLPLPGGHGNENAWSFLRGSDDPQPLTETEVRRLLMAGTGP
jgi:hypothetical protein